MTTVNADDSEFLRFLTIIQHDFSLVVLLTIVYFNEKLKKYWLLFLKIIQNDIQYFED